ncbi:hypothetical protein UT300002_26770 [Clostridium perfringens]
MSKQIAFIKVVKFTFFEELSKKYLKLKYRTYICNDLKCNLIIDRTEIKLLF